MQGTSFILRASPFRYLTFGEFWGEILDSSPKVADSLYTNKRKTSVLPAQPIPQPPTPNPQPPNPKPKSPTPRPQPLQG